MPNLAPMKYKDYVWPHNPTSYTIKYLKEVIQHKYPELNGAELEDFGTNARVFSGQGVFFGEGAYIEFGKLANVFYKKGPGKLIHPNWQPTEAVFYSLALRQEPTPDYVEYEFEFIEYTKLQVIKEIKKETKSTATSANSLTWKGSTLKQGSKGQSVKDLQNLLTKAGYSPGKIDGIYGKKTEDAVRRFQKAQKLQVDGKAGIKTYNALLKKVNGSVPNTKPTNSTTIHVVKGGETLSKIASKYGVNYRDIANANKSLIKDPNSIKIGWKLTIPKK